MLNAKQLTSLILIAVCGLLIGGCAQSMGSKHHDHEGHSHHHDKAGHEHHKDHDHKHHEGHECMHKEGKCHCAGHGKEGHTCGHHKVEAKKTDGKKGEAKKKCNCESGPATYKGA
ncbi:MAG: hypothetical protein HRT45_06390 [Bdellovibrionales bacterium]|nr:hypothetical protein [Bdellovibrionales bacterium]